MDKLKRHTHIERGQALIEYAIIVVLVAILAISILAQLGPAIGEIFSKIVIVLENPQDYTDIIATRDAEIAATQGAEVAATPEAEVAVAPEAEPPTNQDTAIITGVSAKRAGDAGLKVYVSISRPTGLTVATSDGQLVNVRCVESCVITIPQVSNSSGAVTVTSSEGTVVSARYPAKIVSDLLKPETVAPVTGTASSLALALYLGKNLWWKVGFKIASQYAVSGKADVAFRVFHRVIASGKMSSAKASSGWNLISKSLIKNVPSGKLLNFYKVEHGIVDLLPSVGQLEFYTKLGGLYNKLGSFNSALPVFKSAEQILYSKAVASASLASPATQAALFGGLGTTYIRTGDDTNTLRMGNRHLNMAQEHLVDIYDEETKRAVQETIYDGHKQTGRKLPQIRKKEKAWGGAVIDDCEEDDLLYVGKPYILTTSMGWGDAPTTTKKTTFTEFTVPQSLEPSTFEISVLAEDMDVCAQDMDTDTESPWMRTLELDPASDSPVHIQFELTPKAVGKKTVRIDYYYKLHWLQQVTFQVEIVEPPSVSLDTIEGDPVSIQPLRVGALLGLGGRGDRSFNDSVYEGLETARQLYGIKFETADSGTLEENIILLQQWAEGDYDPIITVGYHNGPAIARVARSFPEKRFVIIDTEVEGENIWSAVFREYEIDYEMGALAALIAGKDGRVGFIGGVRIPVVSRIESAFSRGIASVNLDTILDTVYVDRFDDQVMGQYFAEMLYAKGVKVIYQAAGGSGIGAIQAAKKLERLIISTGGDHSELAPNAVLTSRIKNMYRPVLDVVKAAAEGQFEGGKTASYGLIDGGLSLAPIRPEVVKRLVEWLPSGVGLQDLVKRMREIRKAVTGGQIIVDLPPVEETTSSGWDLLLLATLQVGVELLVETGFGDQVHELEEQLAHYTTKAHQAACNCALGQVVKDSGDERIHRLLNHQPFRDAVVTGLLDPVQGFDLQAAAKVQGYQLLILAPILRRFFSVLESALLADETLGALLTHYRTLWYRQDILETMQEQQLDVPSHELVSMVDELLSTSSAIDQNDSIDADTSGISVAEDELANVVQIVVQQIVAERAEVKVPEPRSSTAIYIVARVEAHSDGEPLYLGNKYYLRVGVSRTPIEGFECIDVLLLSGESTLEFDVTVQATDVDVVIDSTKTRRLVWQYEDKEFELLEFALTPLAVGRRKIQVEFHWRRHRLTQIKLDVQVIPAAKRRIEASESRPPLEHYDYPVHVLIRISQEGAQYRAEINHQPVPIEMFLDDLRALNEQLQEAMQVVANRYAEEDELTTTEMEDHLRLLAEAGHLAFEQVFAHNEAKAAIQRLSSLSTNTCIEVASEDFFLPWELLYPISPTESLSYEHFWGIKHIIQREIVQTKRPGAFEPRIIAPDSVPKLGLLTYYRELAGVREKEVPFFEKLAGEGKIELFELRSLGSEGKREGLQEFKVFWDNTLDLAHFACHASYNDKSPYLSHILLSDEFPITLKDMRLSKIAFSSYPLIVMNACETGNLNPLSTLSFAREFIKYGARGVIATECEVPDIFAADFAQQLYARLLAGQPLGESLLSVRRYFWETHYNPSGLLYSMYGPPDIKLTRVGGENEQR